MVYVALLRGINVGGKSKVEMARLKAVFEATGCQLVQTYINSGNVVFEDARDIDTLTPLLENAIAEQFGFTVPVVLRNLPTTQMLCSKIPKTWTNDSNQRTDVLFLWQSHDQPNIMDTIPHKPEIERVRYIEGAIVWNIDRQNATRSSLTKLVGTNIYKFMTIRNINTVRKLRTLMEALQTS